MGGQQTKTRKFTLENDLNTGVIKLSDDVVQRLKGVEKVRNKENFGDARNVGPPMQYAHGAAPMMPFYYEPSLTSIQLRQNQVNELKKNDEYWEKRIIDLQKNHEKIQEIMEVEYNKALKEMGFHEKKATKEKKKAPCQDSKKKVLQCYKKYPNETMRCAKEVQAFAECVDLKRACVVDEMKG